MTFVWEIMLSPQFGIANDWGTRFLGWDRADRLPQPARVHVSLFGCTCARRAADRDRVRGVAVLPVRLPVPARPAAGGARRSWRRPRWSTAPRRPQLFRHILLPQLGAVIALLTVLRFIMTFNKFDDVYLLTGGGAGTEVVSVRVYEFLTARFDIGARRGAGAGARRRSDRAARRSTSRSWRRRGEGRGGERDGPRATVRDRARRLPGAALGRASRSCSWSRCSRSTTWCCCRCAPIEEVLQNPGGSVAGPARVDVGDVPRGAHPGPAVAARASSASCATRRSGRGRRPSLITLLVSIPGAYAVSRLRFVGRRQVHFLFLAVYLFPSILLAIPLFVLFTRLGLRGSLVGADHRLHRADRPGVDLHAAQLPRDDPGEPGGGGRGRRVHPAADHPAR